MTKTMNVKPMSEAEQQALMAQFETRSVKMFLRVMQLPDGQIAFNIGKPPGYATEAESFVIDEVRALLLREMPHILKRAPRPKP